MAIIDAEANEYIRTLRETRLAWLGDLVAETIAEMDDESRDTPIERASAAQRQLDEIRNIVLGVVKQERDFTIELMSIAPELNVQSVVVEMPEGGTVEMTSPERLAAIDIFVGALSAEIEESMRAVRIREGFAE